MTHRRLSTCKATLYALKEVQGHRYYKKILTFSIIKVPKDLLRCNKQVHHLPGCKFEVHLIEFEKPPQVLVPLNCCTGHCRLVVRWCRQRGCTPRVVWIVGAGSRSWRSRVLHSKAFFSPTKNLNLQVNNCWFCTVILQRPFYHLV